MHSPDCGPWHPPNPAHSPDIEPERREADAPRKSRGERSPPRVRPGPRSRASPSRAERLPPHERDHDIDSPGAGLHQHHRSPVHLRQPGIRPLSARLDPLHRAASCLKRRTRPSDGIPSNARPRSHRGRPVRVYCRCSSITHRIVAQRAVAPASVARMRIPHIRQQLLSLRKQRQVQIVRVLMPIPPREMQVNLRLSSPSPLPSQACPTPVKSVDTDRSGTSRSSVPYQASCTGTSRPSG